MKPLLLCHIFELAIEIIAFTMSKIVQQSLLAWLLCATSIFCRSSVVIAFIPRYRATYTINRHFVQNAEARYRTSRPRRMDHECRFRVPRVRLANTEPTMRPFRPIRGLWRQITKLLARRSKRPNEWQDATISSNTVSDVMSNVKEDTMDAQHALNTTVDATPPPTTVTGDHNTRSASPASGVDLSGTWKPALTPQFLKAYDRYLQNCGEGLWFRRALLAAIGLAHEVYRQDDDHHTLTITSVSPVKSWERDLISSSRGDGNDDAVVISSFRDPDGDTVHVEAWWEGPVHVSRLRGKPRVRGGEFESKRYLESPDVLICEATFLPPCTSSSHDRFQKDHVVWRFQRQSSS